MQNLRAVQGVSVELPLDELQNQVQSKQGYFSKSVNFHEFGMMNKGT